MNTYRIWEHNSLGNSILFIDYSRMRVTGHLRVRPKVGDLLESEMESGKIAIFEFVDVELKRDPPDQFFATVKPLKYKD